MNARVAWSGAGNDLRTIRHAGGDTHAVRTTIDTPDCRLKASALATDFSRTDARSEIVRIVKDVVHAADIGTSDG